MITVKNQDNSLKAQIKYYKKLYESKERQSDSKNNKTISKCKRNVIILQQRPESSSFSLISQRKAAALAPCCWSYQPPTFLLPSLHPEQQQWSPDRFFVAVHLQDLRFKDCFRAIFFSFCLSKSILYLENANLQLL